MDLDLTALDESEAATLALRLLSQFEEAREVTRASERRAAGIRKMIYGLVEMFPAIEDLLPEDLDDEDRPRPRGAEAVLRVLEDDAGTWFTVSSVVAMLSRKGWLPDSSNPPNAVRTALERLVDRKAISKSRSTDENVIYSVKPPPAYVGGGDEEPF